MPRQSRGPASSAPKRPSPPTATQARAPPQPPQARQASTAAHPPAQAPPAQQSGGGSGLFGQMASTAAGVAVGSSIGHAIGGFFGGGSSAPAADAAPSEPVAQGADGQYAVNSNFQPPKVCETDVRNFRSCMDENRGDLTICGWYMDQLKACQATAQQYS
ncbi:hypothetical protein B0A50_06453 [Salinomyces thailandicus]|uniref:CHCH domain-containing protein n=1 Tax=Salinomyces thailandicus TaxID=706561 RepID=A0A4U0TPP9_9PEZI|nr:hypothetical protein B0A50_06453 [Salinomyces thailandica]